MTNENRTREELFAILDRTPFPIAVVNVNGDKISFWSKSALALFGHTAPTAAQWYKLAYPDPDYRSEVIARWEPLLEKARISGQTVNTGEYKITCRGGSVRICELFAFFINDKLIVTFNDVTERRSVEQSLRDSRDYLSNIINSVADPIFVKDSECRFTVVNNALCAILGKTKEALIGNTGAEFLPKEEMDHFLAIDKLVLSSGEDNLSEENLTDSNGDVRTIVTKKTRYVNSNGERFIVGIIRDISVRKKTELELKDKLRSLEVFQKASVDREMKMIELKAQIKMLKEKGVGS